MRLRSRSIAAGLAVSALVVSAAGAETLTERFDKTYPLAGKGTVAVTNVNGHVSIQSWDRPEVRIQAEKKAESRHSAEARKAMKELTISVKQTPGGLEIETREPKRGDSIFHWLAGSNVDTQVAYDIRVPKSAALRIETVNGRIEVADVSGALDLETTNGGVEIVRAVGHVEASTTNGAIQAQLLQLSTPLDLSTTNGAIAVELPAGVKANLDAETTNGSIRTDFPVTMSGTLGKSEIRGAINGGGAPMKLRTTNGSIKVTKAAAR